MSKKIERDLKGVETEAEAEEVEIKVFKVVIIDIMDIMEEIKVEEVEVEVEVEDIDHFLRNIDTLIKYVLYFYLCYFFKFKKSL